MSPKLTQPCQGFLRIFRARALLVCSGVVLAISPPAATAEAPQGFTFKELPECAKGRDPFTAPDSLHTKRAGKQLVVLIEAPMSCSGQVIPTVAFGQPRYVSVSLEVRHSEKSPVAACACLRRFEIKLLKPVPKGTVIYLVVEGVARAHKGAA